MSETPTGTDRVELTEDERAQMNCDCAKPYDWDDHVDSCSVPVVESIVAARVQALTAELEAERYEWRQMRAARDATRAELAAANTTILTIERAQAKVEDRADALRAELAAANARAKDADEWQARMVLAHKALEARCAELEEGKDGPYACCRCCPDDDPEYHAENPPNSHSTWCKSCGTPTAIAERDALQATLDRVTALADELRNQLDAASAGLHARQSELEEVQRNLRAAEDRIERWKDVARASFTDRDSIPGDPQGGWRWKWRIPKMEPDFRARISRLADNLSGFIPSDALGSPEERAAAAATSKHWERNLRVVLSGPGTKDGDHDA